MASFHISPPLVVNPRSVISKGVDLESLKLKAFNPQFLLLQPPKSRNLNPPGVSINGEDNGCIEPIKPTRRSRKKGPTSSDSEVPKKTKRSKKSEVVNGAVEPEPVSAIQTEYPESDLEDYDDGVDFPYDDPPLVCCFGAAQKEFVPRVRVSDNPMHPDIYSQWKMLQWDPPEFVRAPGGSPSNVAISHVRLGGRAAFMGKVGKDDFGDELVLMMNKERVQTRAVKLDSTAKTAMTYMKIKFDDERMWAETVKESAEDSLLCSELNLAVLKEARVFHFTSEVLTSPSM
ncbi:fructokinase-like 1, chloroplastic [Pyrus communis]|uniref:fructokinase-like 1, chloroplastic n=1 Tax=Pyrus communis TaxID=23211 RepID=UPI0035C0C77C